MRSFQKSALLLAVVLTGVANAADPANSADERTKKAEASWESVAGSKPVLHTTKHFIVLSPETLAKRLKEVGQLLEKHHDKAKEALKFEGKEEDKGEVLPSKVIVYLFAERNHFKAFVRRIEARRLLSEESSSFQADDAQLHIAVGPASRQQGLPVEIRACEQVACLLLARRAGVRTLLPQWFVRGFGRATFYRVAPRDRAVLADRALAAKFARKHGAEDIWDGKVVAEEAEVLQGSLVDFLAYGPGARVFPKLVAGFAPEENKDSKTWGQAFASADLKPKLVAQRWKRWALTAR